MPYRQAAGWSPIGVTLEGEGELLRRFENLGGDLVRIGVSRAEPVGPFHGWRPLMPVTQWRIVKPWSNGA